MRVLRDPFLGRLLMALAVYATLIGLWMGNPLPKPEGTHADARSAHVRH